MTNLGIKDRKSELFAEVSSLVGARIVRSRKALGLNQTHLAQIIGIHRTTLVAFENGDREPSATELFVIANACNVEPDWLLTGIERKNYGSLEITIEDISSILESFSLEDRKRLLKSLFDDYLKNT